ncbi:MAG: cation:proton antiporter [Planctomycetota bacterium]
MMNPVCSPEIIPLLETHNCSIVFNINCLAQGHHLNIILLVGVLIFAGILAAKFSQKFRIPQVIGYVLIGLILGESVLNLVPTETVDSLSPFAVFALGIIGFMIGGELHRDTFKKFGKQFIIILCAEGLAAFFLVAAGTATVAWLAMHDVHKAVALGLVLGAIASATAPAATVNVLWEYKTRGPLTSAVYAIVALDDGLALLLYGFASSIAGAILGNGERSVGKMIFIPSYEIAGAIVLGIAAGALLHLIFKFIRDSDKALAFTIAVVLLVTGLAQTFNLSSILASMTLGATITNLAHPKKKRYAFELLDGFSPPIYALFFVLAGAHLILKDITTAVAVMVIVYLMCRTGGKMLGSWVGAKYAGAASNVQKYLGFCLLSQAGVAIGLAILASHQFDSTLGGYIIMIIMTSTFVVEILGPAFVKFGVKKAGEVGLNITEEDLIHTYSVADVLDSEVPTISADTSLGQIITIFGRTNSFYYPVIDSNKNLIGAITMDGIRNTFATQELYNWLIALDIMEPVAAWTTRQVPLEQAIEEITTLGLEHLPVVDEDGKTFLGVLNYRNVQRKLGAEVLARQERADMMHVTGLT